MLIFALGTLSVGLSFLLGLYVGMDRSGQLTD